MALWSNVNKTYSSGVSPSVVQYYERKLLENLKPELVHSRDAQKRTLPLHNGKRVQFRRMTPFAAITTPLSEGVTPDGQAIVQTAFTSMVKPYGGHIEVTDELNFYLLDSMHQEAAKLLSDQAALSVDTISRDALHSGMNVQYAGSGNASRGVLDATDVLTSAEIKKAVRTLKRNNVKRFSDGFYHAIIHPDTVYDLTAEANSPWQDIATYQNKDNFEKYELGRMLGVKFYESTNAKVFEKLTYVYSNVTSLVASANADAAAKKITVTAVITEDQARELAGKLVDVGYTKTATVYKTPMCIERVVPGAATADIYFRWVPAAAVTDEWTTAQTLTIYPQGAGASDVDVYSTIIYGQDAFGDIELAGNGKNVEIIINPPGSAGSEDPYAQRGTIAWKVKGFTSAILQDLALVRIEHGATA